MTNKKCKNESGARFTNPVVQRGLERMLLNAVRDFGPLERVCDLGCGNGRLALELASHVRQVVGVDRSGDDIAEAREATGTRTNVTFLPAEIDERLPAMFESSGRLFDAVISVDVIEHMYKPRTLIDVAWRALRPGGHLVVCAPYHGYLKNLAIVLAGKWDSHHSVHWDGGHIKFFSVRTLGGALRERGFDVTRFRFFGRAPFVWKNMICVARKPGP